VKHAVEVRLFALGKSEQVRIVWFQYFDMRFMSFFQAFQFQSF
jgi:hypothetical protein